MAACKDAEAAVASSKSGDFAGALTAAARAVASLEWITTNHPETDLAVKIASGETRVASMTSAVFKGEFTATLKRQSDAATNPIMLALLLAERVEDKLDRSRALGDVADAFLQVDSKDAAYDAASTAMRTAKDVFTTDELEKASRIHALSAAMAVVADCGHADEARGQLELLKTWLRELSERSHDSGRDAAIYSTAVEFSFPALIALAEYDLTSTLTLSVAGSGGDDFRQSQYRLTEKLAHHGQLPRALGLIAVMPSDKRTQELLETLLNDFQESGDTAAVEQLASAAKTFCLGTLTCDADATCVESCVKMVAPRAKDVTTLTSLASLLRRGTASASERAEALGSLATAYARLGGKEQCVATLAEAETIVRALPTDEQVSAWVSLAEATTSCGDQPEAALTRLHATLKKNPTDSTYDEQTVLVQLARLHLTDKAKAMAAEFSTAAHAPVDGEESGAPHMELAELAIAIDDHELASTELSHAFTPTPGTRETNSLWLRELSDMCAKAQLWKEALDAALSISERHKRASQVAEVGLQLHRSHATLPPAALDLMHTALVTNAH